MPATKNASSGIGGADGGSSRKKSTKNNASEEPSTTTTAAAATTRRNPTTTATTEEVISNVNTVASCSRVTAVPVGATSAAAAHPTDSLSASVNCGIIGGLAGDSINSALSSTKAVLNPIEVGAAALQDSSR